MSSKIQRVWGGRPVSSRISSVAPSRPYFAPRFRLVCGYWPLRVASSEARASDRSASATARSWLAAKAWVTNWSRSGSS